MLTPITALSRRTANTHMQNRLRNCRQGIEDSCHETSVRMLETRVFWEKHHARLAPFASDYLDSLFDIALHPGAIAGRGDNATWYMHGGKRLTASGKTIWMDLCFDSSGEYGHLESKLASLRATELIGVIARDYPRAFNADHLERLLDVTDLTERGNLALGPDYNLYQTLLELSAANAGIFTDDHRAEIHTRRMASQNYTYALILEILQDQRYELPLQSGLLPLRRPEGKVIYADFRQPSKPTPR